MIFDSVAFINFIKFMKGSFSAKRRFSVAIPDTGEKKSNSMVLKDKVEQILGVDFVVIFSIFSFTNYNFKMF